jgi:hypothetical protein
VEYNKTLGELQYETTQDNKTKNTKHTIQVEYNKTLGELQYDTTQDNKTEQRERNKGH